MSEGDASKVKELLPDILSHQERLDKRRAVLNATIEAFEEAWVLGSKSSLKSGPDSQPENRELSSVDCIYRGMSRLEDQFDDLITRLEEIRRKYLGEKDKR